MVEYPRKVIHIVLNNFSPDYRVLKETSALGKAGYLVLVFALWDFKMPQNEIIDKVSVQRFHLRSRTIFKRKIFLPLIFAECILRMVWVGLRERPDIVHAHDLNGLVVGYLVARLKNCILVYDSHELWSDSIHKSLYPRWATKMALVAERFMIQRANCIITVSKGIAQVMEKRLGVQRPILVRNVPEPSSDGDGLNLRRELDIPPEAIIFLHIGRITPYRGIKLCLKAFIRLNDPRVYLVFLGAQELPHWMNVAIPPHQVDRIRFLPPVHPRRVVALARGADVGLYAIPGDSENHRLCLPNKLFEFIHAGLGVLVTDLPEMSVIVKKYEVGCVFRDGDVSSLVSHMRFLLDNPKALKNMRQASRDASKELNWDLEKSMLLKVYKGFGST